MRSSRKPRYGLDGDDVLRGLGRNDDLDGGAGSDDIRGGAGSDAASYQGVAAPVTVSLDDDADDGAAGERDNVHGDVESVYGGSGDDKLTGSARDNTLDGGTGNDSIAGGGGFDGLYGGAGNDTIDAKDGTADTIDCGPGTDRVSKDAADTATGCERRGAGATLPSARATATIAHFWASGATSTRVKELRVLDVSPVPATVELRCGGRGCPLARRAVRVTSSAGTNFTAAFRGARLGIGAVVEVRVTAPDTVGKYLGFTVRSNGLPAKRRGCLAPGSPKPIRCP